MQFILQAAYSFGKTSHRLYILAIFINKKMTRKLELQLQQVYIHPILHSKLIINAHAMADLGILNNAIEAIKNGSTARPLKKNGEHL
jgi:hypothetical protein